MSYKPKKLTHSNKSMIGFAAAGLTMFASAIAINTYLPGPLGDLLFLVVPLSIMAVTFIANEKFNQKYK